MACGEIMQTALVVAMAIFKFVSSSVLRIERHEKVEVLLPSIAENKTYVARMLKSAFTKMFYFIYKLMTNEAVKVTIYNYLIFRTTLAS